MCWRFLASVRAEITLPSADRDLYVVSIHQKRGEKRTEKGPSRAKQGKNRDRKSVKKYKLISSENANEKVQTN